MPWLLTSIFILGLMPCFGCLLVASRLVTAPEADPAAGGGVIPVPSSFVKLLIDELSCLLWC